MKKIILIGISIISLFVAANSVSISAVIGTDEYCYKMKSANDLKEGIVIPVNVELTKVKESYKSEYTKSDYYQWDAYASFDKPENGWQEGSSSYNPTTTDLASASCKDCPTAEQMVAYLKAGVYWDDNTTVTEGQKTYKLTWDATQYHTGLWIKKRRYIENFYSETEKEYTANLYSGGTFKKLSHLSDDEVINIRTSGEYFFLPACGSFDSSGSFYGAGTYGVYWLGSPNTTSNAYGLFFDSSYALVSNDYRAGGFVRMPTL